jgi:hypothetical protein
VTFDVDLIAEVAPLSAYHRLEREFSRLGFARDLAPDAPICRWRYQRLEVDLMPTDPSVLGFSNRWYPLAVAGASRVVLPSGTAIRLIGAAAFMATKFEAYAGRGQGDLLGSHDAEDIVNLVDGRPELVAEVQRAPDELRTYLAERVAGWLEQPDFADKLTGMIVPDEALTERVQTVLQRLDLMARGA